MPDYDETGYLILTDPEFPVTIAQIIYRQAAPDLNSAGVFRDRLIGNLFYQMLNFRLDDLTREADSPFLGAFVSEGQLVRGNNYQVVGVQVRQGEALSSLDAALTEVERVRRHGFTAAEVERAKSEILNNYERLYNDRENLRNHSLASEYSRNYLENEAVPGIEVEYKLVEQVAGRDKPRRCQSEGGTLRRRQQPFGVRGRAGAGRGQLCPMRMNWRQFSRTCGRSR